MLKLLQQSPLLSPLGQQLFLIAFRWGGGGGGGGGESKFNTFIAWRQWQPTISSVFVIKLHLFVTIKFSSDALKPHQRVMVGNKVYRYSKNRYCDNVRAGCAVMPHQ